LTGGDACRQATFQQCSFERMKNGEQKFSEKILTGIFFAPFSACREIEFFCSFRLASYSGMKCSLLDCNTDGNC